VKLPFLDYSTLALRRHFCEEELRLNRRGAPDIYLEVVPITNSKDHLTCYTLTPLPLSHAFIVLITNQFGTGDPFLDKSSYPMAVIREDTIYTLGGEGGNRLWHPATFQVGKIEEKMGLRANETAELVLEDCRVPEENLLGGEEAYHSKEGFMTAMKTFDNTRPLVGAMAVGIGRAAYEYARDFVKENYLIGRPIPRYAAIAAKLSQVSRKLDAARMLVWRATYMADMGIPNAKEASMSKAAAGQAATQACIDAIEICGAHGSIATEHALLEKWFRDIKVYDIFEGTGNIQRVVIAKRIMPGLKAF